MLRLMGLAGLTAILLYVAAGQMAGSTRLPVGSVVVGATVSQPFGCTTLALEPFDPFCPGRHIHTGIDLAAPTGTTVHSATEGIAYVGFDPKGAGLYVAVSLDAHVRLLYCHLSGVLVRSGDSITAGQIIGLVGATGLATGPHVHFEVQVNRIPVDPERWLSS